MKGNENIFRQITKTRVKKTGLREKFNWHRWIPMGQTPLFEITLTYKDVTEILDSLYSSIEKTDNSKIKNIYKVLDKSKDKITLPSPSCPQSSIKIKLRHEQWIKIIECCQPNDYLVDHLEGKISLLRKYRQSTMF